MNITQEKTGELTAKLTVEIVEKDYAEQLDKELKAHRKKAALPGFRPGKVPMEIIQKKYGTAIMAEEINKIISNALNEYIKSNELDVLGYPIPNVENGNQLDFASNKEFTLYFDYALTPQIKLDVSENTEVDYYDIIPEDALVERFINDIRTRFGKFEDAEEIMETDKVEASLKEVDAEGKIIENGISGASHDLLSFIKDEKVKERFIGLKANDTLIINTFQATGSVEASAKILGIETYDTDKIETEFEVKIEKISRINPADLNEELFMKAFPADEIDSETEFRERVTREASRAYNEESDKIFMQHALDKLIQRADFDLPDEFMKKWLYMSNEGKLSVQKIEKDYTHYKQSMKYQLFENKLIKEYPELEVTDEDIKNEIKTYFSFYIPENDEDSPADRDHQLDLIAENYLKNTKKKEVENIHNQLFNFRLINILKSNLKLNHKEVSYEELIEIIKSDHSHHNHDHHHEHDHDHNHDDDPDHNHPHDHEHDHHHESDHVHEH